MKKKLMIPGPVELSKGVLSAMAEPPTGHRTPDFSEILAECWDDLRQVYQTKNDIVIITGSGTSGMDAAIASTVEEGDEFVCITGGKFGERFVQIVEQYGGIARKVDVAWGRAVNSEDVENAVSEGDAKAVTLTHNETSTGVLHDAKAIGRIAREYGLLFIMDGITSIGGDDVRTDEWGVDICVAGSQKCLAAPSGLAMLSVSKNAWKVISENRTKNYYLNLASYRRAMKKSTTPFTPSVNLIYGLHRALKEALDEGLQNRIKRHRTLAKGTREAARAIGLELLASDEEASNTVTAIRIPEGLSDDDIRGKMNREYGILMAGGQEPLKGKIFRIGHMGNINYEDMIHAFSCLEKVLESSGFKLEKGASVNTAKTIFGD